MERITLKAYAVKHKLSLFNVVKMVKSGELKSETVRENGKETTYIVSEGQSRADTAPVQQKKPLSAMEELERRVSLLEEETASLKKALQKLTGSKT
jgi:uncharacterized protein YceH (UPF0502 family)